MPDDAIRTALEYFNSNKTECLADLKDLIRIPSISFPGFEAAPVRQCAEAVAELLRKSGLTNVHLLESGEGYPSVFGEWTGAPGKQTILLYAHYDVQPVGREELWTTPPFEPAERGGRLYGRGSSDDKAGVSMLAVAVRSFLKSAGSLPVNVKVLIEGEEEMGSTNLDEILQRNLHLLKADSVLIADSGNFDSGVPALTASLRGIVTVNVEVRSLASSVHSGMWGGPLPDPVIALSKMISGIADDEGRPAVPGILDKVRKLSPEEKAALDALPFDEALYRKQTNILDGVRIIGGAGTVYQKLWHLPSIAVNVFEASSRKQAANIINDAAWARIGIRTVPGMDASETLALLTDYLKKQAPWGVQVTVTPETPSPWWTIGGRGPVYEAALRALERGYG